jgi:branched-subunit amino acid aminotransferase/4-amino-4-deoxychorismate lyase
MSTCVFLNGKFYGPEGSPPISEARIPAFDAGFQHSVGLFETMLGGVARRGIEGPRSHGEEVETWALYLDDHLERMAASARELGLSDVLRTEALAEAVLATVERSGLERARIRLTVTGGDLAMVGSTPKPGEDPKRPTPRASDPTVMIVAQPATDYPAAMFERGVACTLADLRANPLNPFEGHKTLNYWPRLRELQKAAAKGAAEALILSVTNHVCSGCVSNILLVKGDRLITPIARGEEQEIAGKDAKPIPSPVLRGITRGWIINRASRLGLEPERRMVTMQDVLDADEVMLTNSSWGVLPVVRIEGSAIGEEKPGRYTLDLRDAWLGTLPGASDAI